MIRTYKYRLYPTPKQATAIEQQLSDLRWLYNSALEHRIRAYRTYETNISYSDQSEELPAIKKQFPQFKQIHSQVLQDVLKRLDKAFQNFFRRVKRGEKPGFPRFKGKDFFTSLCYPQSGFSVIGNRLMLSKIGDVRIKMHRAIPESDIKTCTVSRENGHWYCCLVADININMPEKKTVSKMVGIDLGIENFATLSNGMAIANPKHYRQSQSRLKKLQSRYSKKKSRSVKRKLIRLHTKIANQRRDFLHKTSHTLVNYFDLIAYEDLNIKGMSESENSGLNKSINDAGWASFISMLKYKAESAGTHCIAVNARGTSQTCSNCGTVVKKTLSERLHVCPVCGISLHRDINAAKNILSGTGIGTKASPFSLKPPS